MRKVYVPLTMLGLGGLGWLFLTERGREALRWVGENLPRGTEQLLEWNEAAQRELDRVQMALNRVAESLEAAQ
jgi:DNA-binding MarR family transcriptional regulator